MGCFVLGDLFEATTNPGGVSIFFESGGVELVEVLRVESRFEMLESKSYT